MNRDPVRATVLATKIIPNVAPDMAKELGLQPGEKSRALVTADCDDVTYTALDEATKKADCRVAYAKSFYGGAANANTKLAGETIGILAAPNPAEAKAGLAACVDMVENVCHFVSANEDDTIRVDARSFLGLFTLDFSKPLKVVTDSLYVMRRLEIRQSERENTTASIR